MPQQLALTTEFAATHAAVRQALENLRADFAAQDLSAELRGAAELVLAEVLNNVVEHAMAGRQGGRIRLASRYEAPWLICELHDDGAAMPRLALPEGALPCVATSTGDLPEGGFGWHMIRRLTRELEYRRSDGWNRLRFRLRENGRGDRAAGA